MWFCYLRVCKWTTHYGPVTLVVYPLSVRMLVLFNHANWITNQIWRDGFVGLGNPTILILPNNLPSSPVYKYHWHSHDVPPYNSQLGAYHVSEKGEWAILLSTAVDQNGVAVQNDAFPIVSYFSTTFLLINAKIKEKWGKTTFYML